MKQRKIEYRKTDELIPYINNPRINDYAVDKVAASIAEFGFNVPIVIDKDNVIITGHTRLKAAKKLKLDKVPTISADDLTKAQVKAFRIADNKVSEYASWDEDLLKLELQDLTNIGADLDPIGFETDELDKLFEGLAESLNGEDENSVEDDYYTNKITIPQYQITGECPKLEELLNTDKSKQLIEEIDKSNLSDEEKTFLKFAAERHNVFNYKNIAEYYAHASKEMQELIEKSALVIIDYNDAINYGYVKLSKYIENEIAEQEGFEDDA